MDWDLTIRGEDESIIIKCKNSLTLTLTFPIDYDDRETARLAYKDIEYFNTGEMDRSDLEGDIKKALSSQRKCLQNVKSILLSKMEKINHRSRNNHQKTSESSSGTG